jgi:hypothetical protein
MCLIPEDSHLTVKEASIIMNFCYDDHRYGEYNWKYDDKRSKDLAKALGEGWEGDNFIDCCKDGQKEAEKVWKKINDDYRSFFSHLDYHWVDFPINEEDHYEPFENVRHNIIEINNNLKGFYKNYIKAIPDTDIDKEIDFSELNGTFIEAEIMNVLHNQLISAIHECKINVHNLRVPILDKIKGQMLEDQYRKLSLERYFQEYENNWLISSIKRGISAQEKKQSTAIKHAKIPPLDLAMYYEDIEWVLDLLKRGAKKSIFNDLSLNYVESRYNRLKELSLVLKRVNYLERYLIIVFVDNSGGIISSNRYILICVSFYQAPKTSSINRIITIRQYYIIYQGILRVYGRTLCPIFGTKPLPRRIFL